MTSYVSVPGIVLGLPYTWRWDRNLVINYQYTLLNSPGGRRSHPVALFTRLIKEENRIYSKLFTGEGLVSCGAKPLAAFSCREEHWRLPYGLWRHVSRYLPAYRGRKLCFTVLGVTKLRGYVFVCGVCVSVNKMGTPGSSETTVNFCPSVRRPIPDNGIILNKILGLKAWNSATLIFNGAVNLILICVRLTGGWYGQQVLGRSSCDVSLKSHVHTLRVVRPP